MIFEIHCNPSPAGTAESQYAFIKEAIAKAENSGLTYEVGALGTTVEGSPDELWALIRSMHEAPLVAGADSIMTNIRIAQRKGDDTPRMEALVASHRK